MSSPDTTAPVAKPSWTEAVSHTAAPVESPHSTRSVGAIAVAENHTARPSTCTPAISASCRRAPSGCGTGPSRPSCVLSTGPVCGSPVLVGRPDVLMRRFGSQTAMARLTQVWVTTMPTFS